MRIDFLRWFGRQRRGSIAVFAAGALGLTAFGLGAAVELENVRRVRAEAQKAIDSATLTAARAGTADFHKSGEAMFEINFTTPRAEIEALRFRTPGEGLFSGEARLRYKPMFFKLLGVTSMGVDVQAFAEIPLEPGGPACIIAGDGGVRVGNGVTVDAGDCAMVTEELRETGNPDLDLSEICRDDCAVSDPYSGMVASWMTLMMGLTACDQTLPLIGGKRVVEEEVTKFYNSGSYRRFCEEVKVREGGTIHFFGEQVYFDGGLTIEKDGRIDGSGAPGSTFVIGANSSVVVKDGGTLALIGPDTGLLAGVAITSTGVSGTGETQKIEINGGGHLHLEGMIDVPDKDFELKGPATLNDPGEPLAIVARSITFKGPDLTVNMGPDIAGPGAPHIGGQTRAPRLVRRPAR